MPLADRPRPQLAYLSAAEPSFTTQKKPCSIRARLKFDFLKPTLSLASKSSSVGGEQRSLQDPFPTTKPMMAQEQLK